MGAAKGPKATTGQGTYSALRKGSRSELAESAEDWRLEAQRPGRGRERQKNLKLEGTPRARCEAEALKLKPAKVEDSTEASFPFSPSFSNSCVRFVAYRLSLVVH